MISNLLKNRENFEIMEENLPDNLFLLSRKLQFLI